MYIAMEILLRNMIWHINCYIHSTASHVFWANSLSLKLGVNLTNLYVKNLEKIFCFNLEPRRGIYFGKGICLMIFKSKDRSHIIHFFKVFENQILWHKKGFFISHNFKWNILNLYFTTCILINIFNFKIIEKQTRQQH